MSYKINFHVYFYVLKMAYEGCNRVMDLRHRNREDSHCMTLFIFENLNMSLFSEIYFGNKWLGS